MNAKLFSYYRYYCCGVSVVTGRSHATVVRFVLAQSPATCNHLNFIFCFPCLHEIVTILARLIGNNLIVHYSLMLCKGKKERDGAKAGSSTMSQATSAQAPPSGSGPAPAPAVPAPAPAVPAPAAPPKSNAKPAGADAGDGQYENINADPPAAPPPPPA
ncbi:hypothetical protein KIN20_007554 [Parelaphostrongylus tenuis]|uniref:Uncharacterized protein n=1 Tax=Parelaphostrongylus tenuis TaxID=148309 RepID=A0AAD5M3K8_PARTN|nr:hypothetical protein KIN20_007554 [Parelaphostrongylus tenuis]